MTGFSGHGEVITDFASITQVNILAFPSESRSVYLDVSSLVIYGLSPNSNLRSHLTHILPSHPGTTNLTG